jgi:hypothetical protein
MLKNVFLCSRKLPDILIRFYWNLNFHDKTFEKYSNTKFHENPSSGNRVDITYLSFIDCLTPLPALSL